MYFNASFFTVLTSGIILTASIIHAQCYQDSECPGNLICDNGECKKVPSGGPDIEEGENGEYIGGYDEQNEKKSSSKKSAYSGFISGTQFITPGFLYANSLVGVEYEIGLNRVLGLQVGAGFIGAEFGAVVHMIARSNFDLHLIADGNVAFGVGVLPGISLGMRGLFGKAARAGLGGKIGVAFCTTYFYSGNVYHEPGDPLIIIGIGAPIRIH
jgi:hypothetical protein